MRKTLTLPRKAHAEIRAALAEDQATLAKLAATIDAEAARLGIALRPAASIEALKKRHAAPAPTNNLSKEMN